MFVGGSKRLGRKGLRLGFGLRVTKKNMLYMGLIFLFAVIIHLMVRLMYWYVIAMGYFLYYIFVWPFKKLSQAIKNRNHDTIEN